MNCSPCSACSHPPTPMQKINMRTWSIRSQYVVTLFAVLSTIVVSAQTPFGPPITPTAQRNALAAVRSQVNWLQNATRTASAGSQGYANLWQQFQSVRGAYHGLTLTLNSRQLTEGANDLAELDAGLGIIQEAFSNHEDAIAAGASPVSALRDLCEILRESSRIWLDELNSSSSKLRIGSG